jgi:hypothetical protein
MREEGEEEELDREGEGKEGEVVMGAEERVGKRMNEDKAHCWLETA